MWTHLSLEKLINLLSIEKSHISISDIMEAVNLHEEEAIKLIQTILDENPELGDFDVDSKIYIHKADVEIKDYLGKAKAFLNQLKVSSSL